VTRNSILGNGLEEKMQERIFMVRKGNIRISPTKTEERKLTFAGHPYYMPGTVLRCFYTFYSLNPHDSIMRKLFSFYK
jgi:hypothetical protein